MRPFLSHNNNNHNTYFQEGNLNVVPNLFLLVAPLPMVMVYPLCKVGRSKETRASKEYTCSVSVCGYCHS
jgi:hypothetical protein